MNASRRALLGVSALAIPAALLAGCAGSGTPALTPQQVVDDANNIVKALGNTVTQIGVAQPGLIPAAVITQIKGYTDDAVSVLASLSASVSATTSATVLQQVVADIQAVLGALAALPNMPQTVVEVTTAANVVLPIVVAFVQSTLGIVLPGKTFAAAPTSSMSLAQARRILSASH